MLAQIYQAAARARISSACRNWVKEGRMRPAATLLGNAFTAMTRKPARARVDPQLDTGHPR